MNNRLPLTLGFGLTLLAGHVMAANVRAFDPLTDDRFYDPSTMVEAAQRTAVAQRSGDYWSTERMRQAVSLDMALNGEPQPSMEFQSGRETPATAGRYATGLAPEIDAQALDALQLATQLIEPRAEEAAAAEQAIVQAVSASSSADEDDEPGFDDRPYPFSSLEPADAAYTSYPYRTIGKLFFSQNGGDYVCSASAVVSQGQRLVVTAGHCVADGAGQWSSNVRFVPAYHDGQAPFGSWQACGLYTKTAWFDDGDFSHDLGLIQICDQPDGTRLQQVIGALGWASNFAREQHYNSFGYPQGAPFDGSDLINCQASHALDDGFSAPATHGMGCDMTGGSSGGPWIITQGRPGQQRYYFNGLNSYKYSGQPNVMYSPYIGDSFDDLRQYAEDRGA